MRSALWALILLIATGVSAAAADIAGTWKTVVTGGVIHKTISQATFVFEVDGTQLTGTAHVGGRGYPGTAPISDGKIDGNRISFTVVGRYPSSNGLPTMKFDGAVNGQEIALTMELFDGTVDTGKTELKGTKISK